MYLVELVLLCDLLVDVQLLNVVVWVFCAFAVIVHSSNSAVNSRLNVLFMERCVLITANIRTNEREITSLLDYFSKRVQYIFKLYLKYTDKRARNITFT